MTPLRHLADLYEKLYFHEVEAREQLNSRLQIPLALLVSLVGLLGFLLQNLDRDHIGWWAYAFYVSFSTAILFVGLSGYYFLRAAWGHEYAFLPTAKSWNDYRGQCDVTYAAYHNKDFLTDNALQKAVYDEYIKCSSINAEVNALRSFNYYLTIRYLITAVVSAGVAFGIFYAGKLDKTAEVTVVKPIEMKAVEIAVVNPVKIKGNIMATNDPAPPPPPPPPPTRFVRDDRRPNSPPPQQPEKKNGQ